MMEEQKLQLEPEVIDGGDMVDETKMSSEEVEVDKEVVRKVEDEDDEEFYERIEAPKFIDFTKPYTFRTDDRYWFCSRVGCDRKHEEEIDPEEISKNFVLRVMAARSPNIKLRKALNKEHSSMKCPLSAPAKPSKSRIPRLQVVSCSISQKISDEQKNIKPRSKVGSTPVVKTRQVAAKYMTTPRNKKCLPNTNSCQSVPNPKRTVADVAKTRTVAKALVFNSPKKAIVLKKSVELHTPLRKICEGMKKLNIASEKKTLLLKSIKSKPKKPETEDSSRKQVKICNGDKKSKNLVPSKSLKTPKKEIPTHNSQSLHEKVVENVSGDVDVDVELRDGLKGDLDSLTNLEDKENMGSGEDHLNDEVEGNVSEQVDDDDGKENAPNPKENNNRVNNQPLGGKINGKETHKKNKVVKNARPALAKCKTPKLTNVKPFRLRTDERGILREANLERKLNLPTHEKAVAKDINIIKKMQVRSKPVPKRPTQQKPENLLRTKPQGVGSPRKVRRPGQQLGVIKEKSCKLIGDDVVQNKTRAVSAPKRRPVTIAKEPNFHTSHHPRSCSNKVA